MSRIRRLSPETANRIAAGEVVERPASVVKELCENALDAGATQIEVQVSGGGQTLIQIRDNGQGMDAEDAKLAFEAHATSKLCRIEDLDTLTTMGFRGEALASIAAVSQIDLVTRTVSTPQGLHLTLAGGKLEREEAIGAAVGTTISVKNLFYNVPARLKFLKTPQTETLRITEWVQKLAMARPDVAIDYQVERQRVIQTPGNGDLESTIYALFGRKIASQLMTLPESVEGEGQEGQEGQAGQAPPVVITGLIGQPSFTRNTRTHQFYFVNDRPVRSALLAKAVDEAYRGRLMKGKHPFVLLKLYLPPHLADINVHPQKLEVKFWDTHVVYRKLLKRLNQALDEAVLPPGDWSDQKEPIHLQMDRITWNEAPAPSHPATPQRSALDDQAIDQPLNALRVAQSAASKPDNSFIAPNPIRVNLAFAEAQHPLWMEEMSGPPQTADTEETGVDRPVQAQPSAERSEQPPHLPSAEPPIVRPAVEALGIARRLQDLPYLGQAFQTYLILQDQDCLWWVDQHAAHEKILFEQLYAAFKAGTLPVQPLLIPQTIELSGAERSLVLMHRADFAAMGYEIDEFGEQEIILRSQPDFAGQTGPSEGFWAILDYLKDEEKSTLQPWTHQQAYDVLAEVACKAAIKGHDELTAVEAKGLLEQLEALEQPYNCPHGRPLVIRMTRYELEKRFKRIV